MKSFFFCLILPVAAVCETVAVQENVNVSVGNLLVVSSQIDQKPVRLIVDTGATHTTLDSQFARDLFPNHPIRNVVLTGTTNAKESPKWMQASVTVGSLTVPTSPVFLINLDGLRLLMNNSADGVLGMDIMQKKAFRFLASAPLFEFTSTAISTAGYKHLSGVADQAGRLHVVARAGSRDFSLLLDTGSSVTALPEDLWEAGEGETIDYDSADINGRSQGKIRLGAPMDITVGDGLVLKKIRPHLLPKGSLGILGLDALKNVEILRIPCESGQNGGEWYGRTINHPISK